MDTHPSSTYRKGIEFEKARLEKLLDDPEQELIKTVRERLKEIQNELTALNAGKHWTQQIPAGDTAIKTAGLLFRKG